MRVPRWETGTSPVGVLGVRPQPPGAAAEGPFELADCRAAPEEVVISFFLASERDQPVAEGDRLRVGDGVVRPSAARLADPLDPTQILTVDLLSLQGGGEPVSLYGEVREVRYRPAPEAPGRVVLLHDHGREAGERDTADERIAAYSELALGVLCQPTPALGCPYPADTMLSLYRLSAGAAAPLAQRTRDPDALEGALSDLRVVGEQGVAPYFRLPDGVSPGGIPLGLGECDGADSASGCWPALVLAAGSAQTSDVILDPEALPAGARLLAAGLVDRPDLRRLACQTGGFFEPLARPDDLRLLTNRSVTDIDDYGYGFARKVLMALGGQWEAVVSLSGVPADYDPATPWELTGALSVTLGDQTASSEFRVILGGY